MRGPVKHCLDRLAPHGGDVFLVLLTYIDHAVRTADGWRIAKRTLYPLASWVQEAPPE